MELSELIKNAKLPRKEREIKFWSEKYNQALKSLGIIPIMGEEGKIQNNKIHIKRFNEKYPFYPTMLELIERESDEEILKSKVVQEIISYLEIAHKDGNILVQKGNLQSVSKKVYSKEKSKILKDLKMMIYEGVLNKNINNSSKPLLNIESVTPTGYDNIISEKSKQPAKKKKRNSNKEIDDAFYKLKEALNQIEMYDSANKCFYLTEYEKITSLRSFQFLLTYFVLEILGKGINEVDKVEIYSKFNSSFSIKRNYKAQKMTTQNWNLFQKKWLQKLDESNFYSDLSKEMKNISLLQS
ncbi:MAG: hypothetical protein ACTJF0_11510 [Psychroflexus halocasei]